MVALVIDQRTLLLEKLVCVLTAGAAEGHGNGSGVCAGKGFFYAARTGFCFLAHCFILDSSTFSRGRRSREEARANCFCASAVLPSQSSASPHFRCSRPQLGAYFAASENFASARSERFCATNISPHNSSGSAKCGPFWLASLSCGSAPVRSPRSFSALAHS